MDPLGQSSNNFSNPESADADGLVALGGSMSVPRLLEAYRSGIFPWTDNPVSWWSPNPRAIFELENMSMPDRIAKFIIQEKLTFSIDRAFGQVIRACASSTPARGETWISPRFIESYEKFHQAGHAHSLEVWKNGELAGGVYGVAIGSFFAGESMFYRTPNASKAALFRLFEFLKQNQFTLFDTQVINPFTQSLGAIEIPRTEYLTRLRHAISQAISIKWNF